MKNKNYENLVNRITQGHHNNFESCNGEIMRLRIFIVFVWWNSWLLKRNDEKQEIARMKLYDRR